MKKEKQTIGRIDKADLPEMQLTSIDVKVDTGAYTSSLHCHHIQILEREGKRVLGFKLLDPSHQEYHDKTYFFSNFVQKQVKSSSGHAEHRYIIKTPLLLFGRKFLTEFSLTDRGTMKFPILLGRKFLVRRFIVDVSQKDLSYQKKS